MRIRAAHPHRHVRVTRILAAIVGSLLCGCLCLAQQPGGGASRAPGEPDLLFYLSGDHGFKADYAAGGNPDPNFLYDVKILPGGAKGSYLQCGNNQLLSYWAPGNIYAQRGTLAFFWRSRDPVDETEFPIFRVGYGDHSSWDMVWLRIDYNGHGFDAFVTDDNLGRTRISYTMPNFPKAGEWVHLALAWDENSGIRFYVNGKLVATKAATGPFDAALDQFGPHARLIAPTGVESSYNYDRGGDIDEVRIYDRMISDQRIAALAKGEVAPVTSPAATEQAEWQPSTQKEWWYRYGWNQPNHIPEPLPAEQTTIRKVEIHDAYDLKRWWWKGTDGIPETTWPGVFNRSTLVGRWDYFQLPDWDCYTVSGRSVTFYLPNEPWNHLEIRSGAWGKFDLLTPGNGNPAAVADPDQHDTSPMLAKLLFEKSRDSQRTTFDLLQPITGEKVRFTNAQPEWPIQEFEAYYVHPGAEPEGIAVLHYVMTAHRPADNPALASLAEFIRNRFPAEERTTMVAVPGVALGGGRTSIGHGRASDESTAQATAPLPIVHLLIPSDYRALETDIGHGTTYSWENMHAGLDGIAIDLPPLNIHPTHDEYVPMNIQIKDPIWPMRNMLDYSFSIKPGHPYTLWLDTRDRILPNGKSLYITLASASPEFGTQSIEGMRVRLIFKPYKDALPEHISDRLTQVRDNYANLVEESVNSRKLNIFNRFDADITDLLRVDPDNDLGRKYWNELNHEQLHPPYTLPTAPAGVPEWAFLQTQDLAQLKSLINWYVDNRQISDGEFGGGLCDDSDFLNWWPGLAMMGSTPDKLKNSLLRTLDEIYADGMFTNGLATGQYDELHSYEDGINVLGQAMQIDYGSPKQLERAMQTAKRLEWLTGYNSAGQRQIRSSYYSATKMATGGVWGWAKDRSYMVFHPALLLAEYNGTPETVKMITEVADGFLAHRHPDTPGGPERMHFTVNFHTNQDLPSNGMTPWFVLWGAYKFTGDQKYIVPFADNGADALRTINADAMDILHTRDTWGKQLLASHAADRRTDSGNSTETTEQLAWQLTGDTSYLDKVYASQLETAFDREFINRQGSLWIDRVYYNNGELQRGRLGGVALMRNYDFPGNVVSWRFNGADDDTKVAILVPVGTPDHIRILAYNLADKPIAAKMTGWEVDPGEWQITRSTQASDNAPLTGTTTRTATFERSRSLDVTFAPRTTTVLELTLKTKGVPYWSRPDLGIDPEDVTIIGHRMQVKVHSLGAVAAPPARIVVRDAKGNVIATAHTPPLKPPTDLIPKTALVTLHLPSGADLTGGLVTIEMPGTLPETTLMNNTVRLPPVSAAAPPALPMRR
ncbi:MAG TPA: LamG domain-containing protein [Candidatus Aquilonibacter sp.]|nr:LamG domain-containing protein [Candidatus Aquilonibacter sp.]